MHELEMDIIAEFIARILVEHAAPVDVGRQVIEFRQAYQTLYYCFDNGLPSRTS
jgi:glycine hydroxymethyltransferase